MFALLEASRHFFPQRLSAIIANVGREVSLNNTNVERRKYDACIYIYGDVCGHVTSAWCVSLSVRAKNERSERYFLVFRSFYIYDACVCVCVLLDELSEY